MEITVLLFAELREGAGHGSLTLEVDEECTAGGIAEALAAKLPDLAGGIRRAAIAVNQAYVDSEHRVASGDEVAVIPPVSGG